MRRYKELTKEQKEFLLKNGATMTALELSRAIGFSSTKIKSELKSAGIKEHYKMYNMTKPAKYLPQPRYTYPSGLLPKIEKKFVRPKADHTNRRFLYKEIEEMA